VSWPDVPARETLRRLTEEGAELSEAIAGFGDWVREQAGGARPLYVGFNACFDWSFTHYAFAAADVDDPFGYVALDIKSYWAGRAGIRYAETGKGSLPAWLTDDLGPHTHRADDDAVRQAQIFRRMAAYPCSPARAWRATPSFASGDEHRAVRAFLDAEVDEGRAEYVPVERGSTHAGHLIRRRDTGDVWRMIEPGARSHGGLEPVPA